MWMPEKARRLRWLSPTRRVRLSDLDRFDGRKVAAARRKANSEMFLALAPQGWQELGFQYEIAPSAINRSY